MAATVLGKGRLCFSKITRLSSFSSRNLCRNGYYNSSFEIPKNKFQSIQPKTSYIPVLPRYMCSENTKTSMLEDLKSSPTPAVWLGFSGAIPFCSLAGLSFITPTYLDTIMHAQCAYGACILTFLGAIHWGFAIAQDSPLKANWGTLGYSVTPSLVAWSALLLKPQYGLVTIAIGLLYSLTKDIGTPYFPRWYHGLRKVLTTLAVSSVLLTATAFYLQ